MNQPNPKRLPLLLLYLYPWDEKIHSTPPHCTIPEDVLVGQHNEFPSLPYLIIACTKWALYADYSFARASLRLKSRSLAQTILLVAVPVFIMPDKNNFSHGAHSQKT